MAIRKTRLPSQYQQVEYIESSGTQYIDTQFNPQNGFKIQANVIITSLASRSTLFGFNGSSQESFLRINANGSATFWANTVGGAVPNLTFSTNTKYNIECYFNSSAYIKVDGTTIQTLTTTNSYYNGSMPLLCCGNIGSSNTDYGYFQLFGCCIYDSANSIVRNFIPCYRKTDNVIGLYDTVNGIFYTNAGSGDFTKGNDVMPKVKKLIKNNDYVIRAYKGSSLYYNALPSEFKAVEYIESDGTQYIDTGVIPTNNTEVNADFIVVNFNSNVVNYMFGNYETGKLFALYRNTSDIFGVMFSNYDNFSSYQIQLDTRYKAKLNSTGAYINGSSIKSFTTLPDFTATNSLYIFKGNGSSRPPAILKLYGFTIKKSNKVIRKLIPCYRVSDTTIGLYDLVNGVFYTNAGTGTFTKGANI